MLIVGICSIAQLRKLILNLDTQNAKANNNVIITDHNRETYNITQQVTTTTECVWFA